jgi:acetylornithine deacetylase/succinyl-diaminopimelate desuccinylase-like protein
MMGGTVPTAEIVGVLQVPFAIIPLVNADNNQHAANENLRMGNYVSGVRTIYGLLTHPL